MIDVVLPCLDESAALPWVLTRMPEGHRPIVVDNGSTDGSAEVAEAHGALVVREPRRGFGAACHAGLLAATADIVCFMDADASLDPADLPKVVRLLADAAPEPSRADGAVADRALVDGTGADLVLGRRRPVSFRAWPPHARLGNAVVARRAGLGDLGPMRAARRTRLLGLDLTDRRSGYPLEMVLRARAQGWRIAETDVAYHPRTGRSKVTGTVRGTLRAVRDMRRVLETV
ncbi:glycosyltransferase family 2 protein [Actinoallomurus spadix]|uniref:Glycosyltransferase family 2 protein n=1 Tax=Actinoallomurus spadix TaxID=79912 RepID=A0ABN0X505_9ACTN|nr:glycosyltransferase family 2 protein [Actinoallomurus spadix]MCO5986780.1 glycosyltransferase family 2 protein [Actinoallomurus spadix]